MKSYHRHKPPSCWINKTTWRRILRSTILIFDRQKVIDKLLLFAQVARNNYEKFTKIMPFIRKLHT